MRTHWGMRIVSALLVAVLLCAEMNVTAWAGEDGIFDNEEITDELLDWAEKEFSSACIDEMESIRHLLLKQEFFMLM